MPWLVLVVQEEEFRPGHGVGLVSKEPVQHPPGAVGGGLSRANGRRFGQDHQRAGADGIERQE